MRVTDKMMFDRATREGGAARVKQEQAVAKASSGIRVSHPGDDPAAAGLIAVERIRAERLDAVATGAQRASDELVSADAALDSVANAIARARELAVQVTNPTYDASARAVAAKEVRGLLASTIAGLNVKVGGRYVLGGTADGAPPFVVDPLAPAGAPNPDYVFAGLGDVREVEIAPGVRQAASVRADVAVTGAGGGVNVLSTLNALATALESNNATAATATLDALTRGTQQVADARGQAGSAMATLDAAVAAGKAGRDDARAGVGKLADADPIAAATELAFAQRGLEAALTAIAKGFQLTLLDKL